MGAGTGERPVRVAELERLLDDLKLAVENRDEASTRREAQRCQVLRVTGVILNFVNAPTRLKSLMDKVAFSEKAEEMIRGLHRKVYTQYSICNMKFCKSQLLVKRTV